MEKKYVLSLLRQGIARSGGCLCGMRMSSPYRGQVLPGLRCGNKSPADHVRQMRCGIEKILFWRQIQNCSRYSRHSCRGIWRASFLPGLHRNRDRSDHCHNLHLRYWRHLGVYRRHSDPCRSHEYRRPGKTAQ